MDVGDVLNYGLCGLDYFGGHRHVAEAVGARIAIRVRDCLDPSAYDWTERARWKVYCSTARHCMPKNGEEDSKAF
jgi:hypothetical protein